jgi:hypothetical protein
MFVTTYSQSCGFALSSKAQAEAWVLPFPPSVTPRSYLGTFGVHASHIHDKVFAYSKTTDSTLLSQYDKDLN